MAPASLQMIDPPKSQENESILQIATELIQQLQVSNFNPKSVSWEEFVARDRVGQPNLPTIQVPVGWCVLTWTELILPPELKGKLEPEEWRPLLASSIIFSSKLKRKKFLGITARIGGPLFLVALGFVTLFATWSSTLTAPLLVADLIGTLIVPVYGALIVSPFLRRMSLEADRLAARQV